MFSFSAYQTGTVCGTGTIGAWTVDVNVFNNMPTGSGMTAGGVFTTPNAGVFFFSACLLCQEVHLQP